MKTGVVGSAALFTFVFCIGCNRDSDSTPKSDVERGPTGAAASKPLAKKASSHAETFPPARDACELIAADEVAALVGRPIQSRREQLERPHEAICAYGTADGWSVLYVTAYWSGGKHEWETRQPVRGAGEALTGIGDAAHYGGILPSMVMKGDILLEFSMPLLPDEKTNFPTLARKAVSRL